MNSDEKAEGFFPETREKNVLRLRDRFLIENMAARKGRRLVYCGLSGVNATDVVLWKDYLERVVIVQRPFENDGEEDDFKTTLILRLNTYFNGNIQLVFGDIWDFLASAEFANLPAFPDVLNLDFCGGLIYESKMDYPRQRDTFQSVFNAARRNSQDFLLLLTLMPRDKGRQTYKTYLSDHVDSIVQNARAPEREALRKKFESSLRFHERNNLALFKACLPILLTEIGRSFNFSVKLAYCRLYTKMIHFAFECTFVRSVLGLAPDTRETVRFINLPLRKLIEDGTETQSFPPQVPVE